MLHLLWNITMTEKVNTNTRRMLSVWTRLRNGGKLNLSSTSNTLCLVWWQRTDERWCASRQRFTFFSISISLQPLDWCFLAKRGLQRRGSIGLCRRKVFMTKVQRNSKFCPTKFCSLNSAVMHCHTIVLHFTLIYRGISPSSAARAIPHTSLCFAFFLSQHARNKRYFLFTLYSITPFLPPLSRSRFYWHWILIGDARETYRSTLNCHLSHTTLIVKSNPWWQIRWCEQWGFRDWSCGKCTNINVFFHWVMDIVKTDCTVRLIPLMLSVVVKGGSSLSGCEGLDAEVSLWLRSIHWRPCQSLEMAFTPRPLRL